MLNYQIAFHQPIMAVGVCHLLKFAAGLEPAVYGIHRLAYSENSVVTTTPSDHPKKMVFKSRVHSTRLRIHSTDWYKDYFLQLTTDGSSRDISYRNNSF